MAISVKQVLSSNSVIFLCSLITGYSLWVMLSHQQIIQQTITMPVHVYDQQTIIHKSSINVRIEATRTQLRSLGQQPPHITFYREEHQEKQITITPQDILLPETVTLIDYNPKSISVS